jgi:hypothetical protein
MGHLNLTELFEFLPILTNLMSDFLSDRPKVGGRSSARLGYSPKKVKL